MRIEDILHHKEDNHLLPFLWIHGEDEATYRKMVGVIHDANIRSFCVEARPHKEFCQDKWWADMAVILDEAEKRGMKVWILDDKHFPTGFANGAVKDAPAELRRRSICHRSIQVNVGKKIKLKLGKYLAPQNNYDLMSYVMLLYGNEMKLPKKYGTDMLLSCVACNGHETVDVTPYIQDGVLNWTAPAGDWTIEVCSLSHNAGMHRSYINMMDIESCRIQIDAVYEPHYAHFGDKFGTVIAGFFSDEPELGNGNYTKHYNLLGTQQDLPYSNELAAMLEERLGTDWANKLFLLWKNDYNAAETAKVRHIYMDCVTRLVEEYFSKQIGQWCREHGVEYIGHIIEDNNQHARTSTSLGHYFRGLKWQSMAGIDDIGGQVYPGGEDKWDKNIMGYHNDGEFYQYALGKLGSSLGALNPNMQGRTMCEIFGNYGWSEGVRLEKYLVDHFMVRGVNHFVPHAFTCSDYPEKDCPPHFYAQGNNPQYRHFGKLMQYTNRVCNLISNGKVNAPVAILYHGESEWAGKCMLMQKPARICLDNQIDFFFVPADAFGERGFYKTEITDKLTVNGNEFEVLVLPYAQFITPETAQVVQELTLNGGKVLIIDARPEGLTNGELLPEAVNRAIVVPLNSLYDHLKHYCTVKLQPENNRIRAMHYRGDEELVYLFNEGGEVYEGTVKLPIGSPVCVYNAWENRLEELEVMDGAAKVTLHPSQSLLIVSQKDRQVYPSLVMHGKKRELTSFTQSVCRSIDYPKFDKVREINRLESYHLTNRKFSGFIRYVTEIEPEGGFVGLEITDAYESVEVFVNSKSAGIQVVAPFRYDLTGLCVPGKNQLAIEVATTLERELGGHKKGAPTGITGAVNLYVEEK